MNVNFMFLIVCIFLLQSCSDVKNKPNIHKNEKEINISNTISENETTYVPTSDAVSLMADKSLEFIKTNNMNQNFCILIDMGVHSGKKRFFVWDFKRKQITHRFLVGHGCGEYAWSSDETKNNPNFSNVEDSHLTSLGKYKIGERGYSSWGVNTKYLLHGLEPSNNNALKRIIVFHSWEEVSDEEVFPKGTPEGWGCPTVSNASFKVLDPLLKASSKPVLMWIYNGKD